jgi:hypothetical protein
VNSQPPQHIEGIRASLDHVSTTLKELKDAHKETQASIVELKVALAQSKGSTNERSKVGDWVMSAVISLLTSLGMAKLLIGAGAQGQK